MAIKPILFNTEMVRAILDGRKTCTRRVPSKHSREAYSTYSYWALARKKMSGKEFYEKYPPYQPGDILYVRETWSEWTGGYVYKAWAEPFPQAGAFPHEKWHPSIHMPKEAARIWLKVTDVRIERLQEMTQGDAEKEGAIESVDSETKFRKSALLNFSETWDSTIKKSDLDRYGWQANPWVWVIEFERCEKPEVA